MIVPPHSVPQFISSRITCQGTSPSFVFFPLTIWWGERLSLEILKRGDEFLWAYLAILLFSRLGTNNPTHGFAASCENFCTIWHRSKIWKKDYSFSIFAPLVKIHFLIKNLNSRGFWKVHKIFFKSFDMWRENFCLLLKLQSYQLQELKLSRLYV